MNTVTLKEKKVNRGIMIISILIPLVVAILFGVRLPNVEPLSFLPPIYASINGLTALLLIAAVWAIKNGKRQLHQNLDDKLHCPITGLSGDVCGLSYDLRFYLIWRRRVYPVYILFYFDQSYSFVYCHYTSCTAYVRKSLFKKF